MAKKGLMCCSTTVRAERYMMHRWRQSRMHQLLQALQLKVLTGCQTRAMKQLQLLRLFPRHDETCHLDCIYDRYSALAADYNKHAVYCHGGHRPMLGIGCILKHSCNYSDTTHMSSFVQATMKALPIIICLDVFFSVALPHCLYHTRSTLYRDHQQFIYQTST